MELNVGTIAIIVVVVVIFLRLIVTKNKDGDQK